MYYCQKGSNMQIQTNDMDENRTNRTTLTPTPTHPRPRGRPAGSKKRCCDKTMDEEDKEVPGITQDAHLPISKKTRLDDGSKGTYSISIAIYI